MAEGFLDAEAAWKIAHVDEDFQMRAWGQDAEAMARRERRWREMDAAAKDGAAVGVSRRSHAHDTRVKPVDGGQRPG